jgi:hypothetical protein
MRTIESVHEEGFLYTDVSNSLLKQVVGILIWRIISVILVLTFLKFDPYLQQNTPRLLYRGQSVNKVQGNNLLSTVRTKQNL